MFICMFDESTVLDGLNEQQRRAVTHEGGPLLVLAGAGTGKTRTLVARAAWLRGYQGMPASRILLLTFTRRAAGDMLARADGLAMGGRDGGSGGRICGGTFVGLDDIIRRRLGKRQIGFKSEASAMETASELSHVLAQAQPDLPIVPSHCAASIAALKAEWPRR